MIRTLVLWSEASSANLGVRALAEGTAALVRRAFGEAAVEFQNYGRGPGPVNIGVPRTLLREGLTPHSGLKAWVRSFDLVIDTGAGDSFADIYGTERLRAFCAMAEFVYRCGVPLIRGPQTIGPFASRQGRMLARASLRRTAVLMVRDEASAVAARRLGRAPDVTTTDVVFALPMPEASTTYDVLVNVSGLLWNQNPHVDHHSYRRAVERLVTALRDRGREVTLLAHVLDSAVADNDVPVVRQLSEMWSLPHLVPTSLPGVRAAIAGAQLVIGSRMHACLNALSVSTPAIPLAYSRKFSPLLAGIGWSHSVDLRRAADPVADVLAVVDDDNLDLDLEVGAARSRADQSLLVADEKLRALR